MPYAITHSYDHQREAGLASGAIKRRAAISAYANVLPLIRYLRSKKLSFRRIARRLNDNDLRTRTGAKWTAMQCWRVLQRGS
jgi:hypothetical protein